MVIKLIEQDEKDVVLLGIVEGSINSTWLVAETAYGSFLAYELRNLELEVG